jgi:short-subunit dehydrogenase
MTPEPGMPQAGAAAQQAGSAPLAAWPRQGRGAIIVTGASSGIGAEIARVAAREGREMVLVARSTVALLSLAAEINARGPQTHAVPLDLGAPDAAAALGAALAERGLCCEVLVNNAGFGLVGPAAELDPAQQLGVLDVNLRAAAALALAALPGMMARGHGGILNVASAAAFIPGPGMALYYASKAGLLSLSEALWAEARPAGVAVTCLCPGPVATPFLERAGGLHLGLFRLVPKADARRVAERGWRGLRGAKRVVLPDAAAWFSALGGPFAPHRIVLPALRWLQMGR